jgi:hypothetical protein
MGNFLKFRTSFLFVLGFFATFFITSCNKDAGEGGEGKIKGVVYVKEYTTEGNLFIRKVPAMDQDVFILYGSNTSVGDKVTTSFDGNFEFPGLRDGSYTIYSYSDDSISLGKSKIAVKKDVSLDGGNEVTVDTIFILNYLNSNNATGRIAGKVFLKEYDNDFVYLQRISAATDKDVYLSFANNPVELDRVRTSYDGSYQFNQLLDNTYRIYIYQDDTSLTLKNNIILTSDLTVVNGNLVDADTLFLYKGLDVDQGNAKISGRIWLINYKSNGYDIKDIAYAQDMDVFLIYGDHETYDLHTKTGYDGSFAFENLLKGGYTIYVYSEQEDDFGNLTGATQKIIHAEHFSINADKQKYYMTDTVKTF